MFTACRHWRWAEKKDPLVNWCGLILRRGEQGLCFSRTGINYLTFWLGRAITHSFTCSTSRRAASNSCLSPPANRRALVDPICLKQRAEAAGLYAVEIKDGGSVWKRTGALFFNHLMHWGGEQKEEDKSVLEWAECVCVCVWEYHLTPPAGRLRWHFAWNQRFSDVPTGPRWGHGFGSRIHARAKPVLIKKKYLKDGVVVVVNFTKEQRIVGITRGCFANQCRAIGPSRLRTAVQDQHSFKYRRN